MNIRYETIFKILYMSNLFFKRIAVGDLFTKHDLLLNMRSFHKLENLSILILEMLSLKD